MYSELLHADKTLEFIAGLSTTRMCKVLCRARSPQTGKLRRYRSDLPRWVQDTTDEITGMRTVKNAVGFSRTFEQIQKYRGFDEKQTAAAWDDFKAKNPSFKRITEK
jgi:hypothetical protein